MTELWHLSAEWRDLIELLVWGSVDRTLSSHQAHGQATETWLPLSTISLEHLWHEICPSPIIISPCAEK